MTEKTFSYKAQNGNVCEVVDTFAEMFPMWVGRVLITAETEKWALTAATVASGLATSVIMSPAEAAVETVVPPDRTPDGRVGVLMHVYNRNRFDLKNQLILRIGQCVMTCPTASAFDGLLQAKRKLRIGRSIRLYGDGFEKKGMIGDRKVWRLPVMEGWFTVEDGFGAMEAVAGGNFLVEARDRDSGLAAAEKAASAIRQKAGDVIMPFPGGVCRAGSKSGSLKYKLKASTNHPFCPVLRVLVPDSQLPEGVGCVYEIVVNGLSVEAVKKAIGVGLKEAASVSGVVRISAGNYGGKVGPYKAFLKECIGM